MDLALEAPSCLRRAKCEIAAGTFFLVFRTVAPILRSATNLILELLRNHAPCDIRHISDIHNLRLPSVKGNEV